ncbi:hypothetical protein [Algoriphagus hitonicola]|uniref:DNA polymerase-3 subunit gamma/tau n=1 Tax=Algoriphagus hitonicola TaxID=435880 RepID=A0A1I2V9C3_9BACT|nr:hypothetical protein [Algoriphagus hitonicola]SFG85730.1 hypothetical protein SAMN04487988_10974 [Algoriphagus hitonicola]
MASIGTKITPVQKTISIPSSLSATKKIIKDQGQQPQVEIKDEKRPVEFVSTTEELKPLTQELLDQILIEVKEHFKGLGKNLELAILNQAVRIDGEEVVLEIMGHVQEEIALKMKPDLIQLIRSKASVGKISIRLDIKEEIESQSSKLYTDSDKFRFLTEKHAAFKEFTKRFGLEADY